MASEASPSLRGRRLWQSLVIVRPQAVAKWRHCEAAAATKCCHCEAAGRGNPGLHALAVVTSLQHGLPRRFAPRSDGSRVAASLTKCRHCEAAGRDKVLSLRGRRPWQSRASCPHVSPRRYAPRDDGSGVIYAPRDDGSGVIYAARDELASQCVPSLCIRIMRQVRCQVCRIWRCKSLSSALNFF